MKFLLTSDEVVEAVHTGLLIQLSELRTRYIKHLAELEKDLKPLPVQIFGEIFEILPALPRSAHPGDDSCFQRMFLEYFIDRIGRDLRSMA
jgi:hypothetical protein